MLFVHLEQIPTRLVVDVSDISGTEHLANVYGPGARCSRGAGGSGEYQENSCLLKMETSCVTNLTQNKAGYWQISDNYGWWQPMSLRRCCRRGDLRPY